VSVILFHTEEDALGLVNVIDSELSRTTNVTFVEEIEVHVKLTKPEVNVVLLAIGNIDVVGFELIWSVLG
jgi:predicted transcriptional regulator